MKQLEYFLADEEATIAIGTGLATALKKELTQQALVVYLNGDLGAGKTTLTRGFVRGMGHQGNVKSPTYTIVEPYDLANWRVFHFDLYRLADPEELEYMGIRDYFNDDCCCFIEWPEKGSGLLAKADLTITMAYQDEQRVIKLQAESVRGEQIITELAHIIEL
ncbi:tRNA (adenosine(37)-N6)-threonylcarbamoyltransferase complex ATPase subunit type 1 TsaE [Colwellia sp. E2M01]|uniref:tRNA (adenosine(37)-N6)-threonylcarbamoyltransferase complex ATPase subunit type 1 TsaE n=1 Tax=Colwellia sp. E2M01 TaxID=2841561 RepID=UPI001C0A18BD|nr:tRNA (adenosine(37)-N6)-threonylcarbamoyltransferase complex ATPase subunit type 1 TsaE [Colwellia sp. E2M01]MBU2871205.1 tRNA (adenosine(37)-N6)-threonylcarbamoyltransferase complex ATPase subunit type 1 TsaE [Colwellia sp. E2M01]